MRTSAVIGVIVAIAVATLIYKKNHVVPDAPAVAVAPDAPATPAAPAPGSIAADLHAPIDAAKAAAALSAVPTNANVDGNGAADTKMTTQGTTAVGVPVAK